LNVHFNRKLCMKLCRVYRLGSCVYPLLPSSEHMRRIVLLLALSSAGVLLQLFT